MKRTLYLHIGPMKTGTSTIQSVLRQNEETLYENGILFPRTGRILSKQDGIKVKGTNHLLGFRMNKTRRFSSRRKGIFKELQDELSNNKGHSAIVSTEVISNQYYDTPRLQSLKKYFADLGYDVFVIFYIRPQFRILSSFYVQMVKTRSFAINFDEYMNDILSNADGSRFDYHYYLEPWRSVFGNQLIVRPLFGTGFDLLSDFLNVTGINRDWLIDFDVSSKQSANQSLGAKTIEALRVANAASNALSVDPGGSREFCKRIRGYAKKMDWDDVPFSGVGPERARIIQERFHRSNDQLARTYWGRPWNDMLDTGEVETMVRRVADIKDFEKNELCGLYKTILDAGKTNDAREAELLEWRTANRS